MKMFTKDKSTKDTIIEILSSEWPLSLNKIYNRTKKKYGISVTYQATHKAVNELVAGGALKKENREYQLSVDWINKIERFGKKLREDYLKKDFSEAGKESVEKHMAEIRSYETPYLQYRDKASNMVGCDNELKQLQSFLHKALEGHRQIVFVTGEPGIGKTTLVEEFLKRTVVNDKILIGYGQCVEGYGESEAYMPILEMLNRLCHEEKGKKLTGILRQHAPMWLIQMSWLIKDAELEALQKKVQGATQDRMLREMAETLEMLTADIPLVLVLEDLHWSDCSTLNLISYLAQRRQKSKLMLVVTYRPEEMLSWNHTLEDIKKQLQLHGLCEEIPLKLLSKVFVGKYLAVRFRWEEPPAKLIEMLYRRTDGNPLFMISLVDELVRQEVIALHNNFWELKGKTTEIKVPANAKQIISWQINRLNPEVVHVLEAASVAGMEFSTAAIAAGIGKKMESVEKVCEKLMQCRKFIQLNGIQEWPDGTITSCYRFVHVMHHNVLSEMIKSNNLVHLHRKIGERKEKGFKEQTREIAAELAVHFEQARDYRRAVYYLRQTAENDIKRYAYSEAINNLNKGIELAKHIRDTAERNQQELLLRWTVPNLVNNQLRSVSFKTSDSKFFEDM